MRSFTHELLGIDLLARLCGAQVEGCQIGSNELLFAAGPLRGGSFEADTKTAGAITLLIQAALPAMLFAPAPCHCVLKGGTNGLARSWTFPSASTDFADRQ